jgi:hypothetical protein
MLSLTGFLTYELDTDSLRSSQQCFVLEVVVRDALTGEQAAETVLIRRK